MKRAGSALIVVPLLVIATPIHASTPADGESADPVVELLDGVPASMLSDDGATISYTNLATVWELAGVGLSDREAEFGEVLGAAFVQPAALFQRRMVEFDAARAEVGFSYVDIERAVDVMALPRQLSIVDTAVSSGDIIAAVESDPIWSPLLTVVDGPHGDYFSWGDGRELSRMTPLRPLGVGGQLAIVDQEPATILRTTNHRDVEAAQATLADAVPSILDESVLIIALADVAAAPGDVLQLKAVLRPNVYLPMPSPGEPMGVPTSPPAAETVGTYLATVAVQYSGTDPRTELLVIHPTPTAAADNAASIEQWFSEAHVGDNAVSEVLPITDVESFESVVRVRFAETHEAYRLLTFWNMSRDLLPVGT